MRVMNQCLQRGSLTPAQGCIHDALQSAPEGLLVGEHHQQPQPDAHHHDEHAQHHPPDGLGGFPFVRIGRRAFIPCLPGLGLPLPLAGAETPEHDHHDADAQQQRKNELDDEG